MPATPREVDDFVPKQINIKRSQSEWLEKSPLNLSKFVRTKIDEEMRKEDAIKKL